MVMPYQPLCQFRGALRTSKVRGKLSGGGAVAERCGDSDVQGEGHGQRRGRPLVGDSGGSGGGDRPGGPETRPVRAFRTEKTPAYGAEVPDAGAAGAKTAFRAVYACQIAAHSCEGSDARPLCWRW